MRTTTAAPTPTSPTQAACLIDDAHEALAAAGRYLDGLPAAGSLGVEVGNVRRLLPALRSRACSIDDPNHSPGPDGF